MSVSSSSGLLWQKLTRVIRGGLTCTCVRHYKNVVAGVPKTTPNQDRPLTYEESQPPSAIGVTKSWKSWNTSNLYGEGGKAETAVEDALIRRFFTGTWQMLLLDEIVIKRRHNQIIVVAIIQVPHFMDRLYFLVGYTEEMLSYILKSPVKLEVQLCSSKQKVVFKYV